VHVVGVDRQPPPGVTSHPKVAYHRLLDGEGIPAAPSSTGGKGFTVQVVDHKACLLLAESLGADGLVDGLLSGGHGIGALMVDSRMLSSRFVDVVEAMSDVVVRVHERLTHITDTSGLRESVGSGRAWGRLQVFVMRASPSGAVGRWRQTLGVSLDTVEEEGGWVVTIGDSEAVDDDSKRVLDASFIGGLWWGGVSGVAESAQPRLAALAAPASSASLRSVPAPSKLEEDTPNPAVRLPFHETAVHAGRSGGVAAATPGGLSALLQPTGLITVELGDDGLGGNGGSDDDDVEDDDEEGMLI
jgi:hypothetical protein